MAAENPGICSAKILLVQPISSPTHPLDASYLLSTYLGGSLPACLTFITSLLLPLHLWIFLWHPPLIKCRPVCEVIFGVCAVAASLEGNPLILADSSASGRFSLLLAVCQVDAVGIRVSTLISSATVTRHPSSTSTTPTSPLSQ